MVIPWSHSQHHRHGCRGYGWGRQWRQSGSLWFTIVIVASINDCPLELWAKIYAIRLSLFEGAYYQHVGESSWLIPGREYGSPEDYFRGISCFIQEFVSELVFAVDSMPYLTTCDYPVSITGPESSLSFKPTVVAPTLQVLLKQSLAPDHYKRCASSLRQRFVDPESRGYIFERAHPNTIPADGLELYMTMAWVCTNVL